MLVFQSYLWFIWKLTFVKIKPNFIMKWRSWNRIVPSKDQSTFLCKDTWPKHGTKDSGQKQASSLSPTILHRDHHITCQYGQTTLTIWVRKMRQISYINLLDVLVRPFYTKLLRKIERTAERNWNKNYAKQVAANRNWFHFKFDGVEIWVNPRQCKL